MATNQNPSLRQISSHQRPLKCSRGKPCYRGTRGGTTADNNKQLSHPGLGGRRPHAACIRKTMRSCAAARARAGADNTAPLRVNRSFARVKIMAWGACSARTPSPTKAKAMHAASRTAPAHTLGLPGYFAIVQHAEELDDCLNLTPAIQSVWVCRRYVDTPSALVLGANASYMRQGGGVLVASRDNRDQKKSRTHRSSLTERNSANVTYFLFLFRAS